MLAFAVPSFLLESPLELCHVTGVQEHRDGQVRIRNGHVKLQEWQFALPTPCLYVASH